MPARPQPSWPQRVCALRVRTPGLFPGSIFLYFLPLPQGHGSFRLVVFVMHGYFTKACHRPIPRRRCAAPLSAALWRRSTFPRDSRDPGVIFGHRLLTRRQRASRLRRCLGSRMTSTQNEEADRSVSTRTFPRYPSCTNLRFRAPVPDCHGSAFSKGPARVREEEASYAFDKDGRNTRPEVFGAEENGR